jgi:hypothetical protein
LFVEQIGLPPHLTPHAIPTTPAVGSVDKIYQPTLQQIEIALSPAVPLRHLAMRNWENPELEYSLNRPNQPVLASDELVHLRCNQR